MSRRKPFPKNGDSNGAVPAETPQLTCAHCGGPVAADATVDIVVESDESGLTRLTAGSDRGHVALVGLLVDVCITLDASVVGEYIDGFNEQGLVCARSTERRHD